MQVRLLLFVSLGELVWRTYYLKLNIIWILLHIASPGSIALPTYAQDTCYLWSYQFTFSLEKKLRNWQNCWVYYRWMMTIVLCFFISFHFYIMLVFWNFVVISLFYQKADSWHFHLWASVMPKQEKTRNPMRRNNRDYLHNVTFVLKIPIF